VDNHYVSSIESETIWSIASLLVQTADVKAPHFATVCADALAAEGETDGAILWRRVLPVVNELLSERLACCQHPI
jgi:hypothetical protein